MKKILVTGSDGFIGSHLTEELVRAGYQVKAFVYYNSFNTWGWLDTLPSDVMKNVEIFQGDVRDPNGVKEAMKETAAVFHLAALIAIPFSQTWILASMSSLIVIKTAHRCMHMNLTVTGKMSEP